MLSGWRTSSCASGLASYSISNYYKDMPTLRKTDLTGPAMVFVTTTVIDWIPIFADNTCAQLVLDQLQESSKIMNISVVGYVIMPTHIHILLGLRDIGLLSKFVQTFKSLSARKLKQHPLIKSNSCLMRNGKFAIWKRRFDDIVIYSQKQLRVKLEYIHNNPVKDGLVVEATDWPYSSARDWLLNKNGPVAIDKDSLWLR
jgi:putative transposase